MKGKDQQFHQDQTKIIQCISSGVPLKKILKLIVASIENYDEEGPVYGSIMLYDPLEKHLNNMVRISLPKAFSKNIQPVEVGPYEGSCGTAAFFRRTVTVSDIERDVLWEKHRSTARAFGLKACYSTPILSSKQEVLGTFSLYYKHVHTPSHDMVKMTNLYKRLAAIAIEVSQTKIENNQLKQNRHKVEKKENVLIVEAKSQQILQQLRHALENDEFEVYFQPYFGVDNHNFGIEALIRWNHPNSGLLAPGAFIDVAEETGFILDMEKWVLQQSLYEVSKLHQEGWDNITLSVNVSARQFENEDFAEVVADLLDTFSFIPQQLILEVTERFLIQRENMEVLSQLRELGVKISIDDFGTAYSSLHYLKDLPVDELKIDRSFIANMEKDINTQKIVEMIILLSHQLNLITVAEGVETKTQLQLLTGMQCDRVQGFLFSKPKPIEEIKELYTDAMKRSIGQP